MKREEWQFIVIMLVMILGVQTFIFFAEHEKMVAYNTFIEKLNKSGCIGLMSYFGALDYNGEFNFTNMSVVSNLSPNPSPRG